MRLRRFNQNAGQEIRMKAVIRELADPMEPLPQQPDEPSQHLEDEMVVA